jgi:hypothetical protein
MGWGRRPHWHAAMAWPWRPSAQAMVARRGRAHPGGVASTRAWPRAGRVERVARSAGPWWPDLAWARPDPPYGVARGKKPRRGPPRHAGRGLLGRARRLPGGEMAAAGAPGRPYGRGSSRPDAVVAWSRLPAPARALSGLV